MTSLAKIVTRGGGQSVLLPDGFRIDGAEVRIAREGARIVLEPVGGGAVGSAIHYEAGNLPPLRAGARAILDAIDAVAPLAVPAGSNKLVAAPGAFAVSVDDCGKPGVGIDDLGQAGLAGTL